MSFLIYHEINYAQFGWPGQSIAHNCASICLLFLSLYVDISFNVFILNFQVLAFDFIWRWWFDAHPYIYI